MADWSNPEIIRSWPQVSLNNGLDSVVYLNLDLPATILGLDFRKAASFLFVFFSQP